MLRFSKYFDWVTAGIQENAIYNSYFCFECVFNCFEKRTLLQTFSVLRRLDWILDDMSNECILCKTNEKSFTD